MPERILIVEDERITAEDIRDILTASGYMITAIVSDSTDVIREAETNPPDLALMDVRIKGELDGTETARILMERFDIPVVYLTAHADRETLARAKWAKPLGYIVKPFQESELLAAVEMALYRNWQDRKSIARHQELTDILRSLLLAVISVDGAESILVFNPAAEELTGWSKEEVIGGPLRKVFRLTDRRTGQHSELPLTDVLTKGTLADLEDRAIVTKNGKHVPISGNVTPVTDLHGGINGAMIVFESAIASLGAPILSAKVKNTPVGPTIQFGRFQVVASSESMKRLVAFALRLATSEANTILIEGESGTGKDLIAQFIHYSSNRLSRPFIPVNCAAIPEALIESELFGHERGAFTDARSEKKGLFELANGGTLFLDEVGELTPSVQAKLLRVLEDQSFRRVGGVHDIEVDVRVIAATNRHLAKAVQQGHFRIDLFHRLSVIPIKLPPLRERPSDILPLATHFIRDYAVKYKSKVRGISRDAGDAMLAYGWPGNVRELRNVIERAVLVEESEALQLANIQFMSLEFLDSEPLPPPPVSHAHDVAMSLKDSEKALVIRALAKAGGNQTKAARLLGITRDMLRYRVKKLGLNPDEF
jgi:PAS domain S-box-containing protein